MILLYSDLLGSICLGETYGIISLYRLVEKVGKVSIKIFNFASLLIEMRAPNRGIFILNILRVVTNNFVIIYAIFMNTHEMVVLSSFRRSIDLLLKTLNITIIIC